ncbi:MAG: DegV family protein [Clostridia bacterium]|nr:DegV family protein [Clostridia bacterium]
MKIAISLDSACDLSESIIKENDFKIIPFGVTMGDRFFYDGEVDTLEIFEYADSHKTLPKTNAVNEEAFKEHFSEILKSYDAIIHFDISSDMSSAYANAVKAAENFENVFIIDSRTLSTGIALEALYAKKLTKTETDPAVIVEKVKERIDVVQTSFVIERLDYLYKGGRCSSLALFGANLLKLRPEIEVKNGKMGSTAKFRGRMKDVVTKYCAQTLEKYNNPDKSVIFITHSKATEEMVEAARAVVKEAGFETIYETTAGCTVSSHCGKNTLGILYINDGGKD